MIILDVETTGTEPNKHSLVSIGAIEFENPSNRFHAECRAFEGAKVMAESLLVIGLTEQEIHDSAKKTEKEIVEEFLVWFDTCQEQTIAGQNPSFDRDFIKAAAERNHLNTHIAHRTIDLHSVCYFHALRRGIVPPIKKRHSGMNSDFIMSYVGIIGEPKPHKALNGAIYETEAFSRLLFDKALLPEFQKYPIPWKNS